MEFDRGLNAANIDRLVYDNRDLTLYFRSGRIVKYLCVPAGIAEGMADAPSPGSYMNRHIDKQYKYEEIQKDPIEVRLSKLEHHKDSTVGLWATDKPENIPAEMKDLFFEIKY